MRQSRTPRHVIPPTRRSFTGPLAQILMKIGGKPALPDSPEHGTFRSFSQRYNPPNYPSPEWCCRNSGSVFSDAKGLSGLRELVGFGPWIPSTVADAAKPAASFLASLRVFFNFSAHVPKECIGILQLTGLEGTIERLHVAAMVLRRRFKRGHHCGSRLERVGPNWNHWGFPLRRRTRSMRASQSGGFRNALSLLHRSSHARRLGHAGPRNLPCRGRQLRHRPVHRREVEPGLLGVREPGKDRWLPRVRPEPSGAWIRKQVRGRVPGSRTGIGGRTKPSPPEHPVPATTRAARAAKSMQQSCGHRSQAGGAALYVVRYSNRRVPS